MTHDLAVDIRAELRRQTAARHAVVDRQMALDGGSANLADYGRFLCMLRHWWSPLERTHWPSLAAPWLRRIEQDLADLPPVPGAGDCRSTGQASDPLWMETGDTNGPMYAGIARHPAYAWGVRYVMEGSQLGSAVLYRRLASTLAPHPLRYLRGDAGGPGPRWQAFLRQLSEQVSTRRARERAVEGACDAFDRLIEVSASSSESSCRV